jgi:hypothetical protein
MGKGLQADKEIHTLCSETGQAGDRGLTNILAGMLYLLYRQGTGYLYCFFMQLEQTPRSKTNIAAYLKYLTCFCP